MPAGFSNCVQGFLIPAFVAAAACSGSDGTESPTAPTRPDSPRVTVEAAEVTRESVPFVGCPAGTPFGLRVVVVLSAGQDVSIRRLGFDFLDRLGATWTSRVVPTSSAPFRGTSIPSSSAPLPSSPVPFSSSVPVPIPSSSPIPIPGSMSLSAGVSRTLPFFLKFGCGVPPAGTLVVSIDTIDGGGSAGTSRVSVNVGG
jgi:hypothetical protein